MENIINKISDAELEILKILWHEKRALNISEIKDEISKKTAWDSSTIKTLVSRLHKKGALKIEKKEVFYYTPVISLEEYNEFSTQKMIDKLYNGDVKNMVASLVSKNKLTKEDIKELENMFKVED